MKLRAPAAWLAVALLAACAALPLAPRDPRPFDLLGRALVSHGGGALSASVRWEHGPQQDEIWLMTPTGQTLAHILDTGAGAVLTRADQQRFRADNVESLTRQALGWPLPLGLMQYWVRGAPAPGSSAAAVERDAAGRLAVFTQSNWRVALTYYPEGGADAGSVRRLDLVDGPNEIRFVIDTWRDIAPR